MTNRQITFGDVMKMFLAHIKLIIIITLISTIIAFCYVSFFVTPIYTTEALILVQNDSSFSYDSNGNINNNNNNLEGEKVNTSDISSSVMLANTCTTLFTKDPDMRSIIGGNSVSISAIEDSYFLTISASSSDPNNAANIANRVAQQAPIVFQKYFGDAGKVDTVNEASVPSSPSSPDVSKYTIYGFIIGLIISLVISFLLEIVDTTIKAGDDLYKIYDIPVFAEIIDFEPEGGSK